MWGHNLLIAITLLNFLQKVLQAQAQCCTLWQPHWQAFTYKVREHEEFHFLAYLAVVALLGFLQHGEILVEHLLLREGHAIDTCHLLTLCVTAPERASYARDLYSLYGAGRQQVRTLAKVGEIALCICGDGTILQVLGDMLHLILLSHSLKLLEGVCLCHFFANHGLVFLGELFHLGLNLREVVLGDGCSLWRHDIIEEACLNGRAETKLDARIKFLQCLCQQVG